MMSAMRCGRALLNVPPLLRLRSVPKPPYNAATSIGVCGMENAFANSEPGTGIYVSTLPRGPLYVDPHP